MQRKKKKTKNITTSGAFWTAGGCLELTACVQPAWGTPCTACWATCLSGSWGIRAARCRKGLLPHPQRAWLMPAPRASPEPATAGVQSRHMHFCLEKKEGKAASPVSRVSNTVKVDGENRPVLFSLLLLKSQVQLSCGLFLPTHLY